MMQEDKLTFLERRRLRAARLLEQGVAQAEVARRVNVSRQSVLRWTRMYEEHGTRALSRADRYGRPRRLTETQQAQLARYLRSGARAHGYATNQWTLARVEALIENRLNVTLSTATVSRLLGDMGLQLGRRKKKLK